MISSIAQTFPIKAKGPEEFQSLRKTDLIRRLESCGHHADDLMRNVIKHHLPPENHGIQSVAPLPKFMADDDHMISFRLIFFRIECATDRRTNSKHIKIV